jgi:hypothetical protein
MRYGDKIELVAGAFAGAVLRAGWNRAACPLCEYTEGSPDKKKSLGLDTQTGKWSCFRCGSYGFLRAEHISLLPDMVAFYGLDPSDVFEGITKPRPKPREPVEGIRTLALYEQPGIEMAELDIYREYMTGTGRDPETKQRRRGLPIDVVREAGVAACLRGRCSGRVVVPLPEYDERADRTKWRGWVARYVLGPHERPYMYPKGLNRDAYLYNEPALWVETDTPVLVVEGTMDALALWPDAAAVLGKPMSSQIDKLVAARRPVCVVLDGDAWQEAYALAMRLRLRGQRAGTVKLSPKEDPDEVDRSALFELARRSIQ